MKTLIDQNRFLKAVEYVSANHFSKPYSITPLVDRWFNQQAVIELEKGGIFDLREDPENYIDITLDGVIIPKKDIRLVEQFYSQYSEYQKDRVKRVAAIDEYTTKLTTDKPTGKKLTKLENLIAQSKKDLEQFDADKIKADKLYADISTRGRSSLNEQDIEKVYGTIKNIVYRPNHGLTHSVRVAYLVTAIHAFGQQHNVAAKNLTEPELNKLQIMMLFSVVGRQDETGFGDGSLARKTYQGFRATSGREYLKYCKDHIKDLYGTDLGTLYRDAIVVELMGYPTFAGALQDRVTNPPQTFIDYVIAMEKEKTPESALITPEAALILINQGKYSLNELFKAGEIRQLAESKLDMMNQAHQLDLIRCYPLYPESLTDAKSIGIFHYNMVLAKFYTFTESPDPQKLTSIYKLFRCELDAQALTGNDSTFGLLTSDEFETQKTDILKQIKDVSDTFKHPLADRVALLKEAKESAKEMDSYQKSTISTYSDEDLLAAYRRHLILKLVANRLTNSPALVQNKQLFAFQHSAKGNPHQVDHHKNAVSIVHALQTITPIQGVTALSAQIIPTITHGRNEDGTFNGTITAFFDTQIYAEQFKESCIQLIGVTPEISTQHGKFCVQIDKKTLQQLVTDQFVALKLPVISRVKHFRERNLVDAIFDEREQAVHFTKIYMDLFGGVAADIIEQDGTYQIQVNRKNFKQLVNDQLVEFKRVTLPKAVTRESTLIDEEGDIDALNLVARNRALVRLVSTTALSGENFPDYEYLFNALEDPVKEKNRYAPLPGEEAQHDWYSDPRTGTRYQRVISDKPMPATRFQEPIYEPQKLSDKFESNQWVVGAPGGDRNTIFTKKLAHSLLPQHGKVIPFTGYAEDALLYFPIGVLSDRELVDMKDERYVWAQNMETRTRFWLNNPSQANKNLYMALNATLDLDGIPTRDKEGVVLLVPQNFKFKPKVLIEDFKRKADEIIAQLDAKYYRPTDVVLNDVSSLVKQYVDALLKQNNIQCSHELKARVKEVYDDLRIRIQLETDRKHSKYALTVRELIEQQKATTTAGGHNEILAGNTKGATRALYACEDTLIARLNIAFHAIKIKQKYHYDVPLLVMSKDNSPYHYTEAKIKADLKGAYELLAKGQFPYDTTLFEVYERDENNKLIYVDGGSVVKKNDKGEPIKEPKSLAYQQNLLVDLFKLGMPKLEKMDQLVQGDIAGEKLDKPMIEGAIDSILAKMDVLGGLARETQLMNKVFTEENPASREKFFLRAAALGHKILIDKIFDSYKFSSTEPLLNKAAQFAAKNNHLELSKYFNTHPLKVEKKALEALFSDLQKPIAADIKFEDRAIFLKERFEDVIGLNKRYSELSLRMDVSELGKKIQPAIVEFGLNPASRTEKNQKCLPEFIKMLDENPDYGLQYARILASNKMVKLDQLIEAHKRHGVGPVTKAMSLIVDAKVSDSKGIDASWEVGNNYLILVEMGAADKAKEYLDSKGIINENNLNSLQNEYLHCLKIIHDESWGEADTQSKDYCEAMQGVFENNKDNFVFLSYQLQQLKAVAECASSPEIKAVREEFNRLKTNAQSFFQIGNSTKAEKIAHAVCQVPLEDRARVFSNESNPACNQVRKELAAHRISFINPVKDDKVIDSDAASSFKEVQKKVGSSTSLFKEKLQREKHENVSETPTMTVH
jgi:hypothetical protein